METCDRLIKIRICLRLTNEDPVHPLGYTFIQDEDQSYYITPHYELIVPDKSEGFIWDDYDTMPISKFTADIVINKLVYPGNFIHIKELGEGINNSYAGKVLRVLRTPVLGFEIKDCIITDELTGKFTKEAFSFYSFASARHDCDSFELTVVQNE